MTLLVGFAMPLCASLAYTLGLSPLAYDISPVVFSVGGVLLAVRIFRFGLFDLVPAGYSLVIDSMGDGMVILDEYSRIVDLNPVAERLIGASDVVGRPISSTPGCLSALECAVQTPSGREELIVKAPERTEYYDARWWPITDGRGRPRGRVLLLRDITEVREAQQEVLRQQRLTATLQEREPVARELHDGVGQVLGYVGVQAQALLKFVDEGATEKVRDCLRKLVVVAKQSHLDVREFIQSTMDPVLTESGLFPAIKAVLQRFADNSGIEAQVIDNRSDQQLSLSPAVDAQVLRIVQEALDNVNKHAGAQHVTITVTDTDYRTIGCCQRRSSSLLVVRLPFADSQKAFAWVIRGIW